MKDLVINKDKSLIGDKLLEKFLNNDRGVSKYISSFFSKEKILEHSEIKSDEFTKKQREILVKVLKSQYENIDISKKTRNNIELILDTNTFSITTGHQLNIFSGPLMVIYKVAQVISLTKKLNSQIKNFNYVPIFWIASEDHDFDEISTVNLNKNTFKWDIETRDVPVGEIKIKDFNKFINGYKDSIINSDYKVMLENMIDRSYTKGDKLSISTIKFINSLFSNHGLIVIDANKKALKNLFIDEFKSEIINSSCKESTMVQIDRLKKDFKSFKPQVNPSDVNFFKFTNKGRKRIRLHNGLFNVDDEKKYDKYSILKQIEINPELFSPNVIMRPLFQEKILPNVCYIGGPNEIKYWLQLKTYFEKNRIQFPILKLRNSAYILNSRISKKIKKTGIQTKYFVGSLDELIRKKLDCQSGSMINFDSLRLNLKKQFDELRQTSSKIDNSFIGALNAQEKKQNKGIDDLEKKLHKAEKKNYETEIEVLKNIYYSLHPNNIDQERHMNFGNFYSKFGQELIDFIVDKILVPDDKILIIDLED